MHTPGPLPEVENPLFAAYRRLAGYLRSTGTLLRCELRQGATLPVTLAEFGAVRLSTGQLCWWQLRSRSSGQGASFVSAIADEAGALTGLQQWGVPVERFLNALPQCAGDTSILRPLES